MESELPRTQGHHYASSDLSGNSAELHSEGHSEGHQEKPSMFKRVKAKARKIKNSLTGHGHDNDHDQDHSHSQDECEEDEDEEMVEDSEIHSAPIYEAAADKGAARASDGQSATGGTNLDGLSMLGPHYVPCKAVDTRSGEDVHHELPHKGINTGAGRDVFEERENPDQIGGPNAMEGIHGAIGTTGSEVDPQGPDIRAHPSNVQIKTIDPANRGNEEAEGITPVITSFNKMGISEEKPKTVGISEEKPKSEQGEGLNTGSHDQFGHDPMPHESSESVPKSYNAANPQDMPEDVHDPTSQSSTYTKKITSASAAAASAIAGTAQSCKNAIASKIGQTREPGEGSEPGEGNRSGSVIGTEPGEGNKLPSVMGTASDYGHRIAATVTDTLAPVYGKVVGVGSGATSEVSGLGAETTQESGGSVGKDKGVSVKEYCEEKLKPGEDDKALSSINTESFSKPKGEKMEEVPSVGGGGHDISQIVSDAVHKREPEESEERKPMGKVTESEEVAKRLGTGEEGSGLGNTGSGAGMVSKLTGAIGSWFGGAQSTPVTTLADDNEGDMGKNADAQGRHQE